MEEEDLDGGVWLCLFLLRRYVRWLLCVGSCLPCDSRVGDEAQGGGINGRVIKGRWDVLLFSQFFF
jgi:hypothetical protein